MAREVVDHDVAPGDEPEPSTPPAAPTERRARRWRDPMLWRRLGLSALSGLVVAVAFPPLDFGPLALVGLVPLLWAWRGATPGRAALCGFVFGVAQMGIVCSWVFYFGAVAIVPFLIAVAVFPAAAGFVVGWLAQRDVQSPWVVAAAFTLFEWCRAFVPVGGLQWGELGVALHGAAPARALASWGGVPLLTFMVVATNALILELILAVRGRRRRGVAIAAGGLAALLVATALGTAFRFQPEKTGTLRYALLQANDVNRYFTAEELAGNPLQTKHLALADELQGRFDLIVFPESSLENDPERDPVLRERLVALAREHDAIVVANAITSDPNDPNTQYNTNLAYAPDGRLVGSYSKQHLVPFGEYVPFPWLRDYIPALSQIPQDFTPGTKRAVFDVNGRSVGNVICFESAFARSVRPYVANGDAEAILVTTNNRSYRRSANSAQHVAMSQMRAAELGRPVLHSAVSGITAVIDAEGNVRQRTKLFETARTEGTITTTTGRTPYARFGDWMIAVSLLILAVGVGMALRNRRRTRLAGAPARS